MLACGFLYAQQISNVRVEQAPALRYYKVTFDLSGKTDKLYLIQAMPCKANRELNNTHYLAGQGIINYCSLGKGLQVFLRLMSFCYHEKHY